MSDSWIRVRFDRTARRFLATGLALAALAAVAAPKVEKYVAAEVLAEADRVWRVAEQGDAIEAGRRSEAIVRAAEALRENGRLPEAREQYRRAALLRPWDFGLKLRQAELLAQTGDVAAARDLAEQIARFVETDREIAACVALGARASEQALPGLDAIAPAPGETVLALVATPETDRWLLTRVGRALEARLGIRVAVAPAALTTIGWDRTGRHQVANELRRTLPWDDPRMGMLRLNGERFQPENLTDDQVIELMRSLLKREANGKGIEALETRVAEADKVHQWDAGILLQRLRKEYPGAEMGRVVYLALVAVDLFLGKANFVYGYAASEGGYAVVSSIRFSAAATGEPASNERLAARTIKQALSSVGFALGVARCADPTCARCLPRSLPEHDAKGSGLCPVCQAGLDKALGRGPAPAVVP